MARSDDSRPLHVCIATPFLAPFSGNQSGPGWHNRWLAEGLAKKGHIVSVIDASLFNPPQIIEPWLETIVMPKPKRSVMPLSLWRALFVRRYLSDTPNLDVFETTNYPGLGALIPRNTAIRFVRLITPNALGLRHLRNGCCNALEAISVYRADATIASTAYIQDRLSRLYRINLSGAYRVPYGLPDIPLPEKLHNDGPIRFLGIGRAEKRKASDVLLKALLLAFHRNDGFTVTLVGSYHNYVNGSEELKRIWAVLTTTFSHRFEVLENIPENQKLDLLAGSDYLLVTSRTESFCIPVIEAMRSGTAAISSAGGGLREVAGRSPGNILYNDPEDPELLANAMTSVVHEGRAIAIKRGREARVAYKQCFHEDLFIDGTIGAYRDALQRRRYAMNH